MKKTTVKVISLLLVFVIFALMAMSSGSSSSEGSKPESNNSNTESQTSSGSKPDSSQSAEKPAEPAKATYTIADEVIVDDENCTFKITKAEEDKIWGLTLKVFCENKTSDKTMMFSMNDVSVNGYMVNSLWTEKVAAGKKSNDEISFSSSSFKEIGITTADEISFSLRIYDSDNWSADEFVEDTFTIYPTGLSASAVTYPPRRTTATEQVVIDNDQVCFVILDTENDSIWGYTLHCYLENKTDKALMFTWKDVSVNGFMIDPFWATDVAPGMRGYKDISFSKSGFEENDITAVEEIAYTMRIYESNNWSADDILKEALTFKP